MSKPIEPKNVLRILAAWQTPRRIMECQPTKHLEIKYREAIAAISRLAILDPKKADALRRELFPRDADESMPPPHRVTGRHSKKRIYDDNARP